MHELTILPATAPLAAHWALAILGLALWASAAVFGARVSATRHALLVRAVRAAVGTLALALFATALRATPGITLATDWPLWIPALLAAGGIEITAAFYALERRTVSPRMGRLLMALRTLVLLGVAALLWRPVLDLRWEETAQRQVVVLVDDSESMHIADTDRSPTRLLGLAKALLPGDEVPLAPHRLDEAGPALTSIMRSLQEWTDWLGTLGSLPPETVESRFDQRADQLRSDLRDAVRKAEAQREAVTATLAAQLPLGKPTQDAVKQLASMIEERVISPLAAAEKAVDGADHYALLAALPTTAGAIEEAASLAERLAGDIDTTFYGTLPADVRERIERNAAQSRLRIAEALLSGPDGAGGLLASLSSDYRVRVYRFAANVREMGDADPGTDSAVQGLTDLTAALAQVADDVAPEDLAGVFILSDGCHNGPKPPDPMARRLGVAGAPVSTVMASAEGAPRDAAVIGLDAPETAASGDRLYVSADVKLDGLRGLAAEVRLIREGTIVDTVRLDIPTDSVRTRVELSDTPEADGVVHYRIAVQQFENEVLRDNNEYPLPVRVSTDRTKLLIMEDRPRWEFRYLKNLFMGRDRAVQLQWVLMHPESIAGQPGPPTVAASVGNPLDEPRATAPPANEEEWLRFDVVVLGDLSPDALSPSDMASLERFVVEAGGTLVIVAGPGHMPHAFGGTDLQELLPVDFRPSTDYQSPPEQSYRIALTPAGRRSVMLRLESTAEANDAAWAQTPDVYWRHPGTVARPTAQVLAFARTGEPESESDIRRHALITTQNVGLGRVVFLSFDRTWRLRSKHGDRYHYKFWGQLLRWAVRGKLPAGTAQVRLGTDRTRYPAHAPVTVTARLQDHHRAPIADAQVAAVIMRDDRVVQRRRLQYHADQPGVYSADIGELPPGDYNVRLAGPEVERLLADQAQEHVETSFGVEPGASIEQVNLSGDGTVPTRLAQTTGGQVVTVAAWRPAMESLRPGNMTVEKRLERPLWNAWAVLGLLCALAAAEWIVRKRLGLP